MIVSFPLSASPTLPETGVSRRPAPAALAAAAWARSVAGATVEASAKTLPGCAPASSPSGPA